MPSVNLNGVGMHYQVEGFADAPPLLLSNSLGTTLELWQPQLEAWRHERRLIRYDTRGHGRSETPAPPYSIEVMAHESLALLDLLNIKRADFCGLSMGGMIGIWIAIHRPDRLNKLVLANTAARIGSAEIWNTRIEAVSTSGMDAVVPQVRSRWFTREFRERHEQAVSAAEVMLRKMDPRGYAYCCEAIRDTDLHRGLKNISVNTLIISGEQDPVIPPEAREALAAAIAGSRHVLLPAAHLSNIEQAHRFTDEVLEFLN